ncbi:hypothetical protein HanIR_Chr14g0691851 [Helianthus annuus]|nr:hypothetical protein HanIR_Chr14g0691851 [Helianthus annuus]
MLHLDPYILCWDIRKTVDIVYNKKKKKKKKLIFFFLTLKFKYLTI